MQHRPRRSALYMPGTNARALDKARTLPADCLILDLEDAVAPEAKALARQQIVDALHRNDYGKREIIIRINALNTPWGHSDIRAMATSGAHAILLPKVEHGTQILEAIDALKHANAPADLPLWIMAETPRGILDIDAIAGAHSRIAAIIMGTSDLAKDLRARHSADRIGLIHALSRCLLAARARGLDILDGVHLDLEDDTGLRSVCEQARDMGFDGKTLIHPGQIAATNEIFAPSAHETALARTIIASWEQAQRDGKGVTVVNGRLIENLHVDEARRTLAMSQAIATLDADNAAH